jgi:hypothetical protein
VNWIEFKVKSFRILSECVLNLVFVSFSHFSLSLSLIAAEKTRHKWHLIFAFTESQESNNAVLQATLHLFVHSRAFLAANGIEHPPNLDTIDIEVAKVLKSNAHKIVFKTFTNLSVPATGEGHFVKLNITDLVIEWFQHHEKSHGVVVKVTAPGSKSSLSHRIVALNADDFVKVINFFSRLNQHQILLQKKK